jgi:hypothetical protein
MMRQIAGSFAEYEKARLVAKLHAARERKRTDSGKCEGRKAWAEINKHWLPSVAAFGRIYANPRPKQPLLASGMGNTVTASGPRPRLQSGGNSAHC